MSSSTHRRLAILAAAALTATGATLATPAQADAQACLAFLEANGQGLGPAASAACDAGAEGDLTGCLTTLQEMGADPGIALRACLLAAVPA